MKLRSSSLVAIRTFWAPLVPPDGLAVSDFVAAWSRFVTALPTSRWMHRSSSALSFAVTVSFVTIRDTPAVSIRTIALAISARHFAAVSGWPWQSTSRMPVVVPWPTDSTSAFVMGRARTPSSKHHAGRTYLVFSGVVASIAATSSSSVGMLSGLTFGMMALME